MEKNEVHRTEGQMLIWHKSVNRLEKSNKGILINEIYYDNTSNRKKYFLSFIYMIPDAIGH